MPFDSTTADTSKLPTRGPRKPPQAPILRDPGDKAIRAHQMMVDHLDGNMTLPQLAQKYDCRPETASRVLQYARDHGLYIDHARQLIEAHLLPRALAVYERYLDGGRQDSAEASDDLDAARDILFGLGALSKSTTVKHTPSDVADTLDSWRQKYFEETAVVTDVTLAPLPAKALPEPAKVTAPIEPPDEDRNPHCDQLALFHSAPPEQAERNQRDEQDDAHEPHLASPERKHDQRDQPADEDHAGHPDAAD